MDLKKNLRLICMQFYSFEKKSSSLYCNKLVLSFTVSEIWGSLRKQLTQFLIFILKYDKFFLLFPHELPSCTFQIDLTYWWLLIPCLYKTGELHSLLRTSGFMYYCKFRNYIVMFLLLWNMWLMWNHNN